jgi:hypothetical protein
MRIFALARNELVRLQNGDSKHFEIWEMISKISQSAFDEIDGERGKQIAKTDNGALHILYEKHK